MELEDYIKELIEEVNKYTIEERIFINTTGTFGKKGDKTYHYRLFNNEGKRIAHFEFNEPKTANQVRIHYVKIYAHPKYFGYMEV